MGISYLLKLAASYQGSLANVCFLISTFFLFFFSLSYYCVSLPPVTLKGKRAATELQADPEQVGKGENT